MKLFLAAENGGLSAKTNKKGEWAVAGLGRGNWDIDFTLEGYEPRRVSVVAPGDGAAADDGNRHEEGRARPERR